MKLFSLSTLVTPHTLYSIEYISNKSVFKDNLAPADLMDKVFTTVLYFVYFCMVAYSSWLAVLSLMLADWFWCDPLCAKVQYVWPWRISYFSSLLCSLIPIFTATYPLHPSLQPVWYLCSLLDTPPPPGKDWVLHPTLAFFLFGLAYYSLICELKCW